MNVFEKMKIKLIDDWRYGWRLLSVQFGIIGTALSAYIVAFPGDVYDMWLSLPAEIRAVIPERYVPMIGVFFFVLSMVFRFYKQNKLQQIKDERAQNESVRASGDRANDQE